MRDVYVLIHGQIRVPNIYVKNINLFNKLLKEDIIQKVIVCTWIGEHPIDFKKHCNFTYLELPRLKDNGYGNWIAQMTNYKHAFKYIKSISENPNDTFILKSRPDAYMTESFFKHIINKPLISGGNIFKHKIWIPWAEMIKPMYLGDELFFGHLNDMEKMYNFNEIYKSDILGQGVAHIRRYINPFLNEYPILKDYIENKNNLNVNILVVNDLNRMRNLSNEIYLYFIKLIKTYYIILNKYFDIETKVDCIVFRQWSNYNQSQYVNPNESISENNKRLCTICRKIKSFGKDALIGNKKCIYNNEYINNVLKGKFNKVDEISKDVFDVIM